MKPTALMTRWQGLPETAIRRLQAEKLARYLRDVVLPFSAHYRELFRQHGLTADNLRTLADLRRFPFTSKADLLNTPDNPQKARDFIVIPDERALARRSATIARGFLTGRDRAN